MTALHPIQQTRVKRFGVQECVDVHCHILPGIDDGPQTIDESLVLCRSLVRDGVTTAIATPHQCGRYDGRNLAQDVRRQVAEFQQVLDARRIPLRILAGGEVRLDERIPDFLQSDHILTLGDTKRYLLLELPSAVPIDPDVVMPHFTDAGVVVVLAHSERYENLQNRPDEAKAWIDCGAVLQVNAGGLIGAFGAAAARAAWHWLAHGWISLIATDAHSVGTRRPRFTDALDAITKNLGEPVARCVCIENPICIAHGHDLLAPPVTAGPANESGEQGKSA